MYRKEREHMAFRDLIRRYLAAEPSKRPENVPLDRLEALEKGFRDLRTDWDATYDKFARLLARWAARDQRANPTNQNGAPTTDPRAEHQARILARRGSHAVR